MQNKRMPLFAIIVLLGAAHSQAQSSVFDHPLSAQNLANFDAICAQLSSRPYTKGVFEQTRTMRRQNRPLVSGGDFIVAADVGLVWITKFPAPSVTTLGRDYMIQSVPGGTETRIEANGNDMYVSMAETISSLFTGNAEKLKQNFDNFYMEVRAANGKTWTMGLIPKDRTFRNFIQQIVLEGADGAQGAVVRSIAISERNGNSLTYAFSGQSFPAALEAHEKVYFPGL
ncbi:MAG: outer membrane lipoprotein carrier protein LolA [Treponema sp.]|jgi:hypothetical protein|nr:outer membrane lipoprotein carrier protein LolA [Treponema sp.]